MESPPEESKMMGGGIPSPPADSDNNLVKRRSHREGSSERPPRPTRTRPKLSPKRGFTQFQKTFLFAAAIIIGVVPYMVMFAFEAGLGDVYSSFDFHYNRLKAWRGDSDASLRLGLLHLHGDPTNAPPHPCNPDPEQII